VNIIELAKKACAPNQTFNSDPEWVERFAALVRAEAYQKGRDDMKEEAAKVCRTAQAQGLQSIREAIEEAIRGLK